MQMDPAERMVLRKRKAALASSFQLSKTLLADLKDAGLLSAEAVQYIEVGCCNIYCMFP
jgi:hypothetical protein